MSYPPPQPDACPLSLSSGFFQVNETTFLLEPLEGAVAGRHAVYRAAHLRGKRGTCREPGATLEYDHEPKIPAAMKLYRWVGIALLLLPQPGSCEEPGGMGAFRASGRCPSPTSCWSDGFWWEQALGSCAVSRRILPPQGLREACGAWCVIPAAAGLGFPACELEEV